jgi:hypothetical protein
MAPDVAALRGRLQNTLRLNAGPITELVNANTKDAERAAGGLYRREPAAWSDDAAVQKKIAGRLGWMASPQLMASSIPRLRQFAEAVKRDGISDVVLLGMGGSSLAPEVLRAILGVAPGSPRFHMLDSTDPAAIRATATPPSTTLYLLASKQWTNDRNLIIASYTSTAKWPTAAISMRTRNRIARMDAFHRVETQLAPGPAPAAANSIVPSEPARSAMKS